jgi:thiamine pyrophosphate-dependent acetolactate synthase large subunit-like protein
MVLTGQGQSEGGVPHIKLPTSPDILNLTDEMIAWIFEKYKAEYPDNFKEKYYDPDYDDWEKETLEALGIEKEYETNKEQDLEEELNEMLRKQGPGASIEIEERFD